ncbi:RE1, partial [Symbiodinium sp. CCMP2456]
LGVRSREFVAPEGELWRYDEWDDRDRVDGDHQDKGPKLVQELSGAAKRYVAGQPAGWVAYRGGVERLMTYLRQALGKPRVNEVTDLLATYFKGTRRKSGESMNEYITRKSEAYMRANQAMKRVQPHYETGAPRPAASPWGAERRHSGDYYSYGWGRQWTPATETDDQTTGLAEDEATHDGSTRATDEAGESEDQQWRHAWRPTGGYTGSWNWNSSWYGSGGNWNWSSSSSTATSEDSTQRAVEVLPAFIQGWYLLMDANLDHGERNLVVTALNGNFSPQRVGQELRNQFPEGETRRRDSRRFQSYLGEAEDYIPDDAELIEGGYDVADLEADGWDHEEIALIAEAENQAQEAMAVMNEARRTLKEARHKQKVVKQNRKYYGNSGNRGPSSFPSRVRDDSNLDCLRCGQRGHRAANCPQKPLGTAAQTDVGTASGSSQQAPFVCMAEATVDQDLSQIYKENSGNYVQAALSAGINQDALTTQEAVRRGMCVIDGGATQTIGSIEALEAVLEQNRRRHGASRLRGINSENPPVFSFGNSTENRRCSTAKIEVSANGKPGEIQVHTLDQGQSPILLSVEALRRLGAIIDFREDFLLIFEARDSSFLILTLTGKDLMSVCDKAYSEGRNNPAEMAAIPAHFVVPLVYLFALLAMDSMNKASLILRLRSYGEEPPETWSKLELKQRLQDLIESGEIPAIKNVKEKTALQKAVTELNKQGKKADLIRYVASEYNIEATPNDTIGTIQRKAMNVILATTTPNGGDLMGFGKFAAKTYREVLDEEPKYVEWARQTEMEGECSVYLRRFIRWVKLHAEQETNEKMVAVAKAKQGARAAPKRTAATTKGYPKISAPVEAASGSNDAAVAALTNVVAQLVQEVQTMKEERAEKPRKVLAKPDMEMEAPNQDVVPNMFESLVSQQRLDLLEVMCEPDSLLTKTFQSRHVWIAPPCGPFSPLQSINQRTPSQIQDLKAKRANALRIYESTLEIVKVCIQLGVHVTVELAERTQTEETEESYISTLEAKHLEAKAKVRNILEEHPLQNTGHSRRDQNQSSDYNLFGVYAHGNHYGLTNRTRDLPELTNGNGDTIEGCEYDIKLKPVVFSPKSWHGSCAWHGDRWVVTVFVSRGFEHVGDDEVTRLRSLGFPTPERTQQAYPAVQRKISQKQRDPDEVIKKQLYLLHCATGHSPPKHMVQALKRRGADERTLKLAEDFKCSVCQEKRRPQTRNLATLEPLPPKLSTICADIGHWVHPHTEESVYFMLIIDEGSRYRTARIISRGPRQAPNAQQCLHYLQEGWVQYFGYPRCLRLDPAGAFRSQAVEDWCDRHSVFLDIIPGEAHWKIGACENAVHGVKEIMQKLCLHDTDLTTEEALSEATACFNQKELIRGFSPAQHVLGQAPDETGRFLTGCKQLPPDLLCENSAGEFERAVKRRSEAEKALCEWQAQQRLQRAKHSRHRPCYDYQPGELVFYWRCQDAQKGRRQPGGKHGRFLGPARILATESRRDEGGNLRPGGSVWLVKGRSLLKCSPEQLRRASDREELLEAMAAPHEQQAPWTYHMVAEQIGGNRYEDISSEIPQVEEWQRAQRPEDEVQPSRFQRERQPAAGRATEDVDMEQDANAQAPTTHRERSRSRGPRTAATSSTPPATAWWSDVKDPQWPLEQSAYWNDTQAAVEIEIDLPESKRGLNKVWNNLSAHFVGSLKRRAVELSERRMTPQELEAFRGAKAIEVKNFVASQAFEILPDHLKPDKGQAINMRWILTWKLREDGSRKPKARAVLLGYQDGSYEHRSTTSPVMTKQTRQLLLQMSAWKGWRVRKGDVTGAFLQSRAYPDKLYCIPCPEICEALGIPAGSVTRVQKACYGLVDAPLEWYRSVDTFLQQLGFERLWSDSCCWALRANGELRGLISGHVDDFLFGGKEGDSLWEEKLKAIKDHFKWSDWEEGKFTQCGVVVEQSDTGFELSQPNYLDNIHEIGINATRRKNREDPTSERERTQLRALLGGLSWHAQQVAPYLAAEVGLLLTEVTRSTVDTMVRTNMLLAHAKQKQSYRMKIHSFTPETQIMFVAWVDAANGNRINGGSTQGIFVGATPTNIMQGDVCDVSPVLWHSQKIDRACRSPGAAESQAAVNGEDDLFSTRFQWSEMLHGRPNLHNPEETVKMVKGCVVTDSRNVYDKLETEVLVIKGSEKRTSIELLALKEAQSRTGVQMRWVHSEAQLANSLTKSNGHREYDLYYRMGHKWRLVEDESMMSARRRKELGLQPLEQPAKKSETSVIDEGCDHQSAEPKSSTNLLQKERGA